MPLESCMILLDNSEYMRNGDYIPTRLEAQQDAANLLVGAKTQSHPESTVGVSAGTELLVSPILKSLSPTASYASISFLFGKLRWHIGEMNLPTRRHHSDPATEVFQLSNVSGPSQVAEKLFCFRAQYLWFYIQLFCCSFEEVVG